VAGVPEKKKSMTKCDACALQKLKQFRPFSDVQLNFVQSFKSGELNADAGATLMVEGTSSAHLYTAYSGWGFRFKTLEDGRRQILNYILPGDLVGLQGGLMGEMQHSIECLTPMTLCIFERSRLVELFKEHPNLAYDLTWIAAREERVLDEHILSIGRRSALERIAYLFGFLHARATGVELNNGQEVTLPLTQQHVADTLGLSIVHTNKTIKKLVERGLVKWLDRGCAVKNKAGLSKISGWEYELPVDRPFI